MMPSRKVAMFQNVAMHFCKALVLARWEAMSSATEVQLERGPKCSRPEVLKPELYQHRPEHTLHTACCAPTPGV